VERSARLRWVPLSRIKVNPLAQRELNPARVDKLASEFDLEQFGTPTANHRDEAFFVIDGQHRVEALKKWFGDGNWEDQQVQCWTYDGLSAEEEAEVFLKLNDILTVHAFSKFRVGVQAGRSDETDIDRIVRSQGLRVSQDKSNGAISAVGTLMKVYRRAGGPVLARTLRIIRDAYGDPGLEAAVIDGLGMLCHRYNGELDDGRLVQRLSGTHGGVNGLLGKAENLRKQTGSPRAHCVAAAAVDINNSGRGGKRLPSWWRAES
jgi:hypothetical protein